MIVRYKNQRPQIDSLSFNIEEHLEHTKYFSKSKALVPGAAVSAWITSYYILESSFQSIPPGAIWIAFLIGLIGTWLVTNKELESIKKPKDNITGQIVLTTISFAVWVAAFGDGGPFKFLPGFEVAYGKIFIIFWTLLLAPNIPINKST